MVEDAHAQRALGGVALAEVEQRLLVPHRVDGALLRRRLVAVEDLPVREPHQRHDHERVRRAGGAVARDEPARLCRAHLHVVERAPRPALAQAHGPVPDEVEKLAHGALRKHHGPCRLVDELHGPHQLAVPRGVQDVVDLRDRRQPLRDAVQVLLRAALLVGAQAGLGQGLRGVLVRLRELREVQPEVAPVHQPVGVHRVDSVDGAGAAPRRKPPGFLLAAAALAQSLGQVGKHHWSVVAAAHVRYEGLCHCRGQLPACGQGGRGEVGAVEAAVAAQHLAVALDREAFGAVDVIVQGPERKHRAPRRGMLLRARHQMLCAGRGSEFARSDGQVVPLCCISVICSLCLTTVPHATGVVDGTVRRRRMAQCLASAIVLEHLKAASAVRAFSREVHTGLLLERLRFLLPPRAVALPNC